MGGAHRSMRSPWRANHPGSIQTVCQHFATPTETPPREAGNVIVSNRKPACSTNEAVKMRKVASWFQKIWIVAENGGPEDRRGFPTSRWDYGSRSPGLQVEPTSRGSDAVLLRLGQGSALPYLVDPILESNRREKN